MELRERIDLLRQKALTEDLTLEEAKEAIIFLRGNREAGVTKAAAKPKGKKAPLKINADDLLKQLEGL